MSVPFRILEAESPEQAAALAGGLREEEILVLCCRTKNDDWRAGDAIGPVIEALGRKAPVILAFEGEGAFAADIAEAGDFVIAARGVMFSGSRGALSAEAALHEGSINRIAETEEARSEAEAVAESISLLAPKAVMAAKRAVREGMLLGLEEGLDLERLLFASLFDTADMKEGTSAFLEKRRAEFKGF